MAAGTSEKILSFNATNWITVTLMGVGSFAILALGLQLWQKKSGN